MTIRKATKSDLKNIQKLYSHHINNTFATWQRKDRPLSYYKEWFKNHGKTHPIFIAENNGEFIGFGSLSEFRDVCGYDKICENSIYVKQEFEGNGYGKLIMQTLLQAAKTLGYFAITAWIDEQNQKSIVFHEKFGFYTIGTMKNIGNKGNTRRSVTIMQLDINSD